jgi:hypothetical protein
VADARSARRRSGRNAASGRASEAFRAPQAGLRNVTGEVGARPLAVREAGSPRRRSLSIEMGKKGYSKVLEI